MEVMVPGPVGELESFVHHLPGVAEESYERFGIVCHPHPLQEGTMDNKVVTTIAKSMLALDTPCVRFNYRGVGSSEGEYGDTAGEVADCLAIIDWVTEQYPNIGKFWLAGFSFGAYIATAAAGQVSTSRLLTVAPAINKSMYNFAEVQAQINCPWLVITGETDEVVAAEDIRVWFNSITLDNKELIVVPATGHYFHGQIPTLKQLIVDHFPVL